MNVVEFDGSVEFDGKIVVGKLKVVEIDGSVESDGKIDAVDLYEYH